MKLASVFAATEAFRNVAALKLPPKVAYQWLKYLNLVAAECEVLEKERNKLLRAAAGVGESEPVSLSPGQPEYVQFVQEFGALLNVDSDLKPMGMKLDDLVSALSIDSANVLSVEDLLNLEPFFQVA